MDTGLEQVVHMRPCGMDAGSERGVFRCRVPDEVVWEWMLVWSRVASVVNDKRLQVFGRRNRQAINTTITH